MAFFISKNLLLIAGYNVIGERGSNRKVYILCPGSRVDREGAVNAYRMEPKFPCSLVELIWTYDGPSSINIAILRSDNYCATHFLPISTRPLPFNANLDIIGYPLVDREWRMRYMEDDWPEGGVSALFTLLPAGPLVTSGKFKGIKEGKIFYDILICPGMSGGCILYNGMVYGNQSLYLALIHVNRAPYRS